MSVRPQSAATGEPVDVAVAPPAPRKAGSRLALGFVASGSIPFLLWLDTRAATAGGWAPAHGLDQVLVWLIYLSSGACLASLALPVARAFYAKNAFKLVMLSGSLLALILGGQYLFARLEASAEPPFHHRPANLVRHYWPDASAVPGIVGKSIYTTNTRGIRGPELDARYKTKILCIGASTTECVYLDDTETWTHLVMTDLNEHFGADRYWVGSVGHMGYTTIQHLQYVQTNEAFAEYDIAVFLIGAGDLLAPLNFRVKPVPRPPRWQRTGYYRVAITLATMADPSIDLMYENPTGSNHHLRRERRAKGQLVRADRELDRNQQLHVKNYAERIQKIVETCRERGVRPIFATQPTLYSESPSPEAEALIWAGQILHSNRFLSIPKLSAYLAEHNETLRSVCAQLNVPCIDLTPMNGNQDYFYDDFHFTEAGARAVADAITVGLIEIESIAPPPQQ